MYCQVLGIVTVLGNYYIHIVTNENKQKMLRLNITNKLTLLFVVVFAISLFLGPVASSVGDNVASAHKSEKCDSKKYYKDHKDYCKEHDDKNHDGKGNLASQGIGQFQSSSQNSQCVSGGDIQDSCNNTSIQNQKNSGNNVLAQQIALQVGSIGDNSASQIIGQFQPSFQNSQVVSGGDIVDSGNSINLQSLLNIGNSALGQQ